MRWGFEAMSKLAVIAGWAVVAAAGETTQVREDFARDPRWDGRNNVSAPAVRRMTVQDFGYSATNHAGGEPGEIGGRISRSLTPAFYARPIPPRTLNDRLRASGRLAVTQSEGGSGALIGWFNHDSRGWRTPNSLVFRIDGEANKFRVFFEYGTQTWKTGGGTTFDGDYQTTKTPLHATDGTPHTWTLEYDPDGAAGRGEIIFTLDGMAYRAPLVPGHRAEGAVFDRFGVMNVQISGSPLTLWLDDIEVEGTKATFDRNPGWEGRGNRGTLEERVVRPHHDFTWRNSAHAGGSPGEIGGIAWRAEQDRPSEACYYGARVGRLTLDDELEASGRMCLRSAAVDSGILFGWFNSGTYIGTPPRSFVGMFIEGPSEVGHYARPVWADLGKGQGVMPRGPIIHPDGKVHQWRLRFSPKAADGRGRITLTFDGELLEVDLPLEARKAGALLDRFGMVSWQRGGQFVEMYFDDLSYTAGRDWDAAGIDDDPDPEEQGLSRSGPTGYADG